MSETISVITFFDCTETGIVNHKCDQYSDLNTWQFERNQQRNFDTILQCIAMRCVTVDITQPVLITYKNQKAWKFSFSSDREHAFLLDGNDYGILEQDCNNVPMLTGLNEEVDLSATPYLITSGKYVNIFFEST